MFEVVRKLFWGLVCLVCGSFMVGFGVCAMKGSVWGLSNLFSATGGALVTLVLTAIGAALTWGFFRLARYCARQIPAQDDSDKASAP